MKRASEPISAFTFILMCVSIYQGFQLSYTPAQTDQLIGATQELASAATAQAKILAMQLEGTQAAIINFEVGLSGGDGVPTLSVQAWNRGHVNAQDVTLNLTFTVRTWPSKERVGEPTTHRFRGRPVAPMGQSGSNAQPDGIFQLVRVPGIADATWANVIGDGRQFVTVEWSGNYDNGFGRRITEYECKAILYLKPIAGQSASALIECGENFEASMRNALKTREAR